MFKFQQIEWRLHPNMDSHIEWLLAIDDFMVLNEFIEFRSKDVMCDYTILKDKTIKGRKGHHNSRLQYAMDALFENKPQETLLGDIKLVSDEFLGTYSKIFKDRGIVYICNNFSIRPITKKEIVNMLSETECEIVRFPEYTDKDIKVTKWPGGSHYYARVGGIDVEIDGITKWHTYMSAYNSAKEFIIILMMGEPHES